MNSDSAGRRPPDPELTHFLVELHAVDGLAAQWCMEAAPDVQSAVVAAVDRSPGFRVVRITASDGTVHDPESAPGWESA
jgi:hypothetical protein